MEYKITFQQGFEDICKQEIKKIIGKNPRKAKGFFKINLDEKELLKLMFFARSAKEIFASENEENKLVVAGQKRTYIVKNNPPNIDCNLAYCLVNYSGFKKKQTLLDPLCCGSKILIEAWHYANKIPNGKFMLNTILQSEFFKSIDEKEKSILIANWSETKNNELEIYGMDSYTGNIADSKVNAQSADAGIKLSCRSIDWVDCVFDEKSVDAIITILPSGSGQSTDVLYREVLSQAEYCLKKNGTVVLVSRRPDAVEKYAKLFSFKITDKRDLGNLGIALKIKRI